MSASRPCPRCQCGVDDYTIAQGDTLSEIAERHGLTVDALLEANPQITNPDYIRAGDNLRLSIPDERYTGFDDTGAASGTSSSDDSLNPETEGEVTEVYDDASGKTYLVSADGVVVEETLTQQGKPTKNGGPNRSCW